MDGRGPPQRVTGTEATEHCGPGGADHTAGGRIHIGTRNIPGKGAVERSAALCRPADVAVCCNGAHGASPSHRPAIDARAARLLREGGLVAFPTETVYGLGADACSDAAVARIFAAKDRPDFNPLIVHLASRADAAKLVRFNAQAERLAARFWPGPPTLVLPRRDDCPVSCWSRRVFRPAVRVPGRDEARSLLQAAGIPVPHPAQTHRGASVPRPRAMWPTDWATRWI